MVRNERRLQTAESAATKLMSAFLVADERDRIQKKTFTKWINKHLSKSERRVDDLFVDLQNGRHLIALLEALTSEHLVSWCSWEKCLLVEKARPARSRHPRKVLSGRQPTTIVVGSH